MLTDPAAYLARLAYPDDLAPTAATLRALHRAHMFGIPFENLDIALGRPIRLEAAALLDKLITGRRGGFCYELNGLFAGLLETLGFRVKRLAARVYSAGQPGPEFDHLCLLVELEQRWLVDVGFGDSFLEPLDLDETGPQRSHGADYQLSAAAGRWRLARRDAGAEWQPAYDFTLAPYSLADFEPMCQYQQTSPASSFTQRRVCSRATAAGRITYSGRGTENRLIITDHGQREEQTLNSPEAVRAALHEHFGVVLPAALPAF